MTYVWPTSPLGLSCRGLDPEESEEDWSGHGTGIVMKTQLEPTRHRPLERCLTIAGQPWMRRDCLDEPLREAGIVDDTTVEKANLLQREESIKPVEAFLCLGVIEEDDLIEFLCQQLNLPSTGLEDATIDLIFQ